jgi:hypothetical protein
MLDDHRGALVPFPGSGCNRKKTPSKLLDYSCNTTTAYVNGALRMMAREMVSETCGAKGNMAGFAQARRDRASQPRAMVAKTNDNTKNHFDQIAESGTGTTCTA